MRRLSSEKMILGLYSLYIINQVLSASQLVDISSINVLLKYSRYAIFVMILLYAWGHGTKVYAPKVRFIFVIVTIAIGIMNMLFVDGGITLFLDVQIVYAFNRKSLKRVFQVTFLTVLLSTLFVVLCCKTGVIEDVVSVRWLGSQTGEFFAGRYERHTFGFLVQNQIPNTFLILYLMLIVMYKGKIPFIQDVIILAIDFWLFSLFGARISFVLTIVAVLLHIIIMFFSKCRNSKYVIKGIIAPTAFIVSCVISFIVCLAYSAGYGYTRMLDRIFNNRIRLGSEAIQYYGIKLIGSGKTSGTYLGTLPNNTVDNGYILLFIQYGLILGVLVMLLWINVAKLCSKSFYCTEALVIFALLNIVDSYLTSYMAIPFMCIMLNQNDPLIRSDEVLIDKRGRTYRIARG